MLLLLYISSTDQSLLYNCKSEAATPVLYYCSDICTYIACIMLSYCQVDPHPHFHWPTVTHLTVTVYLIGLLSSLPVASCATSSPATVATSTSWSVTATEESTSVTVSLAPMPRPLRSSLSGEFSTEQETPSSFLLYSSSSSTSYSSSRSSLPSPTTPPSTLPPRPSRFRWSSWSS